MQFYQGHQTIYTYSATGAKLKVVDKTAPEGVILPVTSLNTVLSNPSVSTITTTDYVGNVIYENGTLKRILTPEGYWQDGTYYYFLKDHLGSNRVVINSSGGIAETSSYYPSGMRFGESAAKLNNSVQPYRHTGLEMQEMHGLNWIDNLARFRTVSDGSGFTGVDPLAEKRYSISPYAYCSGNPVNRIDPDGMDWYKDKDGTRQYDPNVTSQKNLAKGQTYIGVTDAVKDKNGNVMENYRKDGSIMYTSESSGYGRIWNNSIKTGHEEMGVVTDKGVLVLPDYKNDASTVDLKDYNYSTKNGNIVDASGNSFNTIATVHTHLDGSLPSTYDGTGYGDLGFAAFRTPNKPVFVLQMTPNKIDPISFIISGANTHSNFSHFNNYDTYEINKSNLNVQMLLHGTSLRGYTINNAINKLRKIP